eukprot:gnl/MRDRNA2_/MRDRNA2_38573_c0_seq2.p2 gnl/MRDRNA2_/MRDRNA2_38573_c0~~gnl/MRDRNA2_/MRDRNA2_38573_c0_seq2.p2  ORF type:complete len:102 (+),score=8.84 gnl/MRDRNA2_/MRDRNA2_38573_c0_seq2:56-361(+)
MFLQVTGSAIVSNITVSCNAAISACANRGQEQHAVVLLKNMFRESIRPKTILLSYNPAMSVCKKGKHWEFVGEFLEDCTAPTPPDTISRNAIISACEKRGR